MVYPPALSFGMTSARNDLRSRIPRRMNFVALPRLFRLVRELKARLRAGLILHLTDVCHTVKSGSGTYGHAGQTTERTKASFFKTNIWFVVSAIPLPTLLVFKLIQGPTHNRRMLVPAHLGQSICGGTDAIERQLAMGFGRDHQKLGRFSPQSCRRRHEIAACEIWQSKSKLASEEWRTKLMHRLVAAVFALIEDLLALCWARRRMASSFAGMVLAPCHCPLFCPCPCLCLCPCRLSPFSPSLLGGLEVRWVWAWVWVSVWVWHWAAWGPRQHQPAWRMPGPGRCLV